MQQLTILLSTSGGFFGTLEPKDFLGFMMFAIVGFIVINAGDVMTRDPYKENTPIKFKWRTLIEKNWYRWLFNILMIYLGVRFFTEISKVQITDWGALIGGAGSDLVYVLIKYLVSIRKKALGIKE